MLTISILTIILYQLIGFAHVALASDAKLDRFRNLDKRAIEERLKEVLYADMDDRQAERLFLQILTEHELVITRRDFPYIYSMPWFFGFIRLVNYKSSFTNMLTRASVVSIVFAAGLGVILGFLVYRIPTTVKFDLTPSQNTG